MERDGRQVVSRTIGLVAGGLLGALAALFKVLEPSTQVGIEVMGGAISIAWVALVVVCEGLGGSASAGSLSCSVVFATLGMAWSEQHRGGLQVGLNVVLGLLVGASFAIGCWVARRREVRRG